jgi:exodeoxyribonuclease V beta subunit
MEFWVAAHAIDTAELDAAVCESTLEGASRPALERATLNGMLKGFMDLVFEHEGRYYVADYKSNWLGADDEAYSPQRMRAQILHSRYELQYVLYLFALHRLLKARLPDYDYDEHIGGAVYLFVRGIGALSQGVHVERPPRELIETLDALFADRAEALADDTERV